MSTGFRGIKIALGLVRIPRGAVARQRVAATLPDIADFNVSGPVPRGLRAASVTMHAWLNSEHV